MNTQCVNWYVIWEHKEAERGNRQTSLAWIVPQWRKHHGRLLLWGACETMKEVNIVQSYTRQKNENEMWFWETKRRNKERSSVNTAPHQPPVWVEVRLISSNGTTNYSNNQQASVFTRVLADPIYLAAFSVSDGSLQADTNKICVIYVTINS